MAHSIDAHAQALIRRYQQKAFACAFYLAGCNKDTAYTVTAAGFDDAFRSAPSLETGDAFFARVIAAVVRRCREVEVIPTSCELDLQECQESEKDLLTLVARTLQRLDFDEKAFVLLRDQANLSFRDISSVMDISEAEARHGTIQARVRLREKVEETVRGKG